MNTVETIQQKVCGLPVEAQQEALEAIEQIEQRYAAREKSLALNLKPEHPLTATRNLAVDLGITDFAERHDFYAHGKLEN